MKKPGVIGIIRKMHGLFLRGGEITYKTEFLDQATIAVLGNHWDIRTTIMLYNVDHTCPLEEYWSFSKCFRNVFLPTTN